MDRNNNDDDLDIVLNPTTPDVVVVESVRPKAIAIGAVGRSATDIYADAAVLDEVWSHVRTDRSRELGGILIGHLQRDPIPFVRIIDSLDARHTTTTATSLTFTHDTWADLLERMDRNYRGYQILGWYHSHPGHGVFMSRFDRFVHASFFANPWQCALVVDPVNRRQSFFCWSGRDITPIGYYRVGNTGTADVCPPFDDSLPIRGHDDSIEQAKEPAKISCKYGVTIGRALRVRLLTYGVGGRVEVQWGEPGGRFSGEA